MPIRSTHGAKYCHLHALCIPDCDNVVICMNAVKSRGQCGSCIIKDQKKCETTISGLKSLRQVIYDDHVLTQLSNLTDQHQSNCDSQS